jgi:histidinol-phosphate aminotransferase
MLKQHLQNLNRTRASAYSVRNDGLYLDRNERVEEYSDEVMDRLLRSISKIPLNRYPELPLFYRKLSNWLCVPENQIYVTEGVSGAIKSLMETISRPGDNIVCPTPTFALYSVYSEMFQLEHRNIGYTSEYLLNKDQLFEKIDNNTAIVFLPNPNIPIAGTLGLDDLRLIANHCRKNNAFLVIDEVYYPFGGPTAISLIDDYDNIFVIRSFSKAFGLAGIRLGYLLGSAKNIDYVSKTRTGYETNSVSIGIASFFIDNFQLVEDYIHQVKDGFKYLKAELDKHGFKHNGGNDGNFLYVDLGSAELSSNVVKKLQERKIYIRGGWEEPFSKGVSITGASRKDLKKFFLEFIKIYKSIKDTKI